MRWDVGWYSGSPRQPARSVLRPPGEAGNSHTLAGQGVGGTAGCIPPGRRCRRGWWKPTLTGVTTVSVTMRQMLEAGVHFGHQTRYWNPKMSEYIFGQRNKIHIVNLERTLEKYNDAMKYIRQLAANRGTLLM